MGPSDLSRDSESLESYIASFYATLDEPVPSRVMDTRQIEGPVGDIYS